MEKTQLFLIHFAGGSSYSFQFIAPYLTNFDVVTLELPGRGKRISESLITDFEFAAVDLFNQIINNLKKPNFFIYGHSMGSILGLRVAEMLEKVNKKPICLIVSGNPGPMTVQKEKKHLLDDVEFVAELKKLGGLSNEILENKELLDFVIPVLRADFEIVENNELAINSFISSPIFAIMGSKEEKVNDIANWKNYTSSQFSHRVLEGEHFFIHKHPFLLSRLIKNCHDRYIAF